MPTVCPKPSGHQKKPTKRRSSISKTKLETIRNYCERQCEELSEYAMGEQIREILIEEQDHQIALATALGKSVSAPGSAQ
jgi:bacterioferritin